MVTSTTSQVVMETVSPTLTKIETETEIIPIITPKIENLTQVTSQEINQIITVRVEQVIIVTTEITTIKTMVTKTEVDAKM